MGLLCFENFRVSKQPLGEDKLLKGRFLLFFQISDLKLSIKDWFEVNEVKRSGREKVLLVEFVNLDASSELGPPIQVVFSIFALVFSKISFGRRKKLVSEPLGLFDLLQLVSRLLLSVLFLSLFVDFLKFNVFSSLPSSSHYNFHSSVEFVSFEY